MTGFIVFGVIAFILVAMAILSYNKMVAFRNNVKQNRQDRDAALSKRTGLIDRAVATVKGAAKHENETLKAVISQRAEALKNAGAGQALVELKSITEAYPALQTNQNFLQLQNQIAKAEEDVEGSTRAVNGAVEDYNNTIQSFPAVLLAGMFGFKEEQGYTISADKREAAEEGPKVEF